MRRIAITAALGWTLIASLAPGSATADTAEVRVAASADDAEESASGTVTLSSSDLELVYDGSNQIVGMRFRSLPVPRGAAVRNAWVQFETDETGSAAVSLTFQAQAVDNAPAFTTSSRNLSSRARAPGAVSWSPLAWTQVGAAGSAQRTPNLAALVQTVVSRPGWASGNALVLLVTGTGKRTARSWNGDSSGAPLLHVEYGPPASESIVLSGAGDISSCGNENDSKTAALLDDIPGLVFTAGDNAYPDGSADDYNNCYGPTWGRHKARTRPAPGNHEYNTPDAEGYFDYFGAVAGDRTEGWYSYDVGAWHVVVLNSNCSEIGGCARSSPQGLWLQADLAAHPSDCTLAMWHHPRFSSGANHGSQSFMADLWEILDENEADVVLAGHDHLYERFGLQDADGNADPHGIRQFTVGTGGAGLYGFDSPLRNSEVRYNASHGVLKLTLHDTSYDWDFLPVAGSFRDSGSASCVAGSGPGNQPPAVQITEPANGASFASGVPVNFRGSASDPEDGSLSSSISWRSDRDGALGTGALITKSSLSVGTHLITASVQDSSGLGATAQRSVTITQQATLMIEKRIAVGDDDGEENESTHEVFLGSADLELGTDASPQLVGLRFTAVALPRGARILAAWVQFEADSPGSSATSLTIQAQAADDAPPFVRTSRNLSSRTRSTAAVSWAPSAWEAGAQGAAQRTPSLVSVLQQVVDRSGWASGNDLVLIFDGSGQRRAQSYEGKSSAAALLHVEYSQ